MRHLSSDRTDVAVERTQACVASKNQLFQNASDSDGSHMIYSLP